MVDPIYIIAAGLGVSFLLGLFKKAGTNLSGTIMLLALAFMSFVSLEWLWSIVFAGHESHYIYTAGFKPPFSINLLMGRHEAILTSMINILGLFGGLYLWDKFKKEGVNSMVVFLVMVMGLNVIILTRDIFNLFVFLEIVSIGVAGLVVLERNTKALSSGFKYMIGTSIIAGLLLIGIIFAYKISGSLNIDDLVGANIWLVKGGSIAVFLILIAVIFELKPFPANGWGLDIYEGANPGLSAMLSGGIATSSLFVLYKLMPIGGDSWGMPIAITGMVTFLGSNLLGIKQENANRMLGYSSIGQVGLLMMVIGLSTKLGDKFEFIAFTLLISHFLAKAGLFWISGMLDNTQNKNWGILRKKPLMLFLMGSFILALVGLPPFPSFLGKWEFVMQLSSLGMNYWIAGILIGSLLEAVFLFKWFGAAVRSEDAEGNSMKLSIHKLVPIIAAGVGLYVVSYFGLQWMSAEPIAFYLPYAIVIALFLLDFLPVYIKNTIGIAGLGYYAYTLIIEDLLPQGDIIRIVFAAIFIGGGILMLIPGYTHKGKRKGFYPLALLLFVGLGGLVQAETTLQFFFAWEIMTVAAYLLIIRGKNAQKAALSFILFSIAGAYFMLMGFAFSFQSIGTMSLDVLTASTSITSVIFLFLAIGLMFKMATLGLHIWLPGSYAEAEDDVTPMISAIVIKSGIFGFILFMFTGNGSYTLGNIDIPYVLSWIGALSAIIGNLAAIFQEDVKKLVAYSSIGVMGYILFAISMMTNLGWTVAITYAMLHFLYKGLLFLAVAGVIYRTRTRKLYEMGGLIKQMPLSFIAVLIGIITLAGMPPLAGFAGKWLFYNAVILKGFYIQGAMVFFAGIIAFLYCFKLIHNIFLGPVKDNHRKLKETSIWWLIPQFVLIGVIMLFSVQPRLFMEPVTNYLTNIIPGEALKWEGTMASTSLGYWDATQIMMIVGGLFAVLFSTLFFLSRKAQKVKQFNIVYQAEQPFRPETTHVSFNMYAHYNKALGILVAPRVTNFWNGFARVVEDLSNHIRKLYSGNGQAYALHIVLYFIVFYLLLNGGF